VDREFARTDRVADAIQRVLASVIQQQMRDPRVHMVNINAVTVTRDMAYAKVFVTLVGQQDEEICKTVTEVLNRATGFLRNCVSKELDMRTTPRFQFIYDTTPVRGQLLSDLIDKAVAKDIADGSSD
jgi:ribosome-binding factor A